MEKPISLVINEAKASISNAISNANVHPALLELILNDIYADAMNQIREYKKRELADYQNDLLNEKETAQMNQNNKSEVFDEIVDEITE